MIRCASCGKQMWKGDESTKFEDETLCDDCADELVAELRRERDSQEWLESEMG